MPTLTIGGAQPTPEPPSPTRDQAARERIDRWTAELVAMVQGADLARLRRDRLLRLLDDPNLGTPAQRLKAGWREIELLGVVNSAKRRAWPLAESVDKQWKLLSEREKHMLNEDWGIDVERHGGMLACLRRDLGIAPPPERASRRTALNRAAADARARRMSG